jgi:hypothetical protein
MTMESKQKQTDMAESKLVKKKKVALKGVNSIFLYSCWLWSACIMYCEVAVQ